MSSIAVVIPTVTGREDHLAACLEAYEATWHNEGVRVHTVVVRDRPTCGIAWQAGVDHLRGVGTWEQEVASMRGGIDFLHLTADDLVPHAGWAQAAIDAVVKGYLPAPHVLSADGRTQSFGGYGDGALWTESMAGEPSPWCAVPFLPMSLWRKVGPMVPLHYYTDDWFSHRVHQAGWAFRTVDAYRFTHHDALPGRGAGMSQAERAAKDRADFHRYITGEMEVTPCEYLSPAPPASSDGTL